MFLVCCLHSRLHPEGAESRLKPHPRGLPPEITLCGKMEVLDRMLVKLIAAGHKVLHLYSTLPGHAEHKGLWSRQNWFIISNSMQTLDCYVMHGTTM